MKILFFALAILALIPLPSKAIEVKVYEDQATEETYWIIEGASTPTIKVRWDQYGLGGFKIVHFTTNSCGIGNFKLPSSVNNFNIGSLEFNPSIASNAPVCNPDGSTPMANNTAVRVGSLAYVRYLPDPSTPVDKWAANWPDIRDRKATINQCGFVRWKTKSIDSIEINGSMIDKSDIPTFSLDQMPICRKVGTNYIKYVRK